MLINHKIPPFLLPELAPTRTVTSHLCKSCFVLIVSVQSVFAQQFPEPKAYVPKFLREVTTISSLGNCYPQYPRASLRNEEEGAVVIDYTVDRTGIVVDSKVEKSSTFQRLDDASVKVVARCKFRPAAIDGVPIKTSAKLQYVWKLP